MGSTFFADLFNSLGTATQGIGDGIDGVLSVIMPAVQAVFVVYIMFVVWSYWQNSSSIESTAIDMFKRIVMLGILLGFGINYSTYSSTVFPAVTELGNGLAQSWGGAETTGSQLDGIVAKVAEITDTNAMDAETALDNAPIEAGVPTTPNSNPTADNSEGGIIDSMMGAVSGMTDAVITNTIGKLGNTVTSFFQNIVIWLASAVFLVVACAYLLIAQVMLIILASVGPIFFAFAIFPATRQFFNNWIGSVLNYGFLFLFMTISAEIFITYIDFLLDGWRAEIMAGEILQSTTIITLLAMFIIFAVMLLQVPSMTSSLFGGLTAGGFSSLTSAIRGAKGMLPKMGGKKGDSSASGGSVSGKPQKAENKGK